VSVLRLRLAGKELSTPELVVLYAAGRGLSADETATMLIKSRHTVIAQRRSLQAKLGARNLAHAVALAYERGLFEVTTELDELLHGARHAGTRSTRELYDEVDADAPSYHERL
jgi:DNA-binding CsgD family transcriptional regulator